LTLVSLFDDRMKWLGLRVLRSKEPSLREVLPGTRHLHRGGFRLSLAADRSLSEVINVGPVVLVSRLWLRCGPRRLLVSPYLLKQLLLIGEGLLLKHVPAIFPFLTANRLKKLFLCTFELLSLVAHVRPVAAQRFG